MPIKEDFTLTSSLPKIHIPDVSFHEFVLPIMENSRHKICEVEALTGRQETYESILEKSFRVASYLQRHGLGPGDRIGIHCGNVLEYTQVAFGIMRAGCSIVNIRGETFRELRALIEDSKPVYIFTESNRSQTVREAVEGSHFCKDIISFGSSDEGCLSLEQVLKHDGNDFKAPKVRPDEDVLLVSYSSGTTGLPKGVCITHKYFVSCALLQELFPKKRNPNHIALIVNKPVHISGSFFRLGNFHKGDTAVLLPSFDLKNVLNAIQKYRVGEFLLLPTNALTFAKTPLDDDITSVRTILISGGPVSQHVKDTLKEKFKCDGVIYFYAATEGLCSFLPTDFPGSFGTVHANSEAKVVDKETGRALPPGSVGELYFKGPCLMKEYLNNPEATAKAIDEGGFLRTGDLVYYDENERLFYVEREKDIMKCKDSQVSPFELEQILTSHPSVADAAVIAVPHEEFGEVPRAYVVLKAPCEEDLLVGFVNKQVADHKRLRGGLSVVDSIPKSQVGKYLKRELREKYLKEIGQPM